MEVETDRLLAKNNTRSGEEVGRVVVSAATGERLVVTRVLGEGGMGKVYVAADEKTGKLSAIRLVSSNPELITHEQDDLAGAFHQRSLVWFLLGRQKNIVQALRFDRDSNSRFSPFLVMEYATGGSLRDLLDALGKRGEVPELPKTVRTAVEVLTGLLYARKVLADELHMDFVHRNLKPENILFDENDVAKVSDFVLSGSSEKGGPESTLRQADEKENMLQADGDSARIPLYLAPEQWTGTGLDERTDVYALGCVIYEMIAGRPPFLADSRWEYARQHLHEAPLMAPLTQRGTPMYVRDLLVRCLAKQKEQRPSLRDTRAELQQIHQALCGHPHAVCDTAEQSEPWELANRVLVLRCLEKHLKASECRSAAAETDGDHVIAHNNGEVPHRALGDNRRAGGDYDTGIESDSKVEALYTVEHPNVDHQVTWNKERAARESLKAFIKVEPSEDTKPLEEARRHLETILGDRRDPSDDAGDLNENGNDYYHLGNECSDSGDYEQAIGLYDKAVEVDAAHANVYHKRGHAYYKLEDYEAAIEDFSRAIEMDGNHAAAYHNRGLAYACLGVLPRAMADYNAAISLDATYAEAYTSRGNAYKALRENERAIADYTRAIDLGNKRAVTYRDRGLVYQALGDLHRAIADYNEAIRLDREYVAAYNDRGEAYNALGIIYKAIADFDKAMALDPDDATAYYNRGNIYYHLKDVPRAIGHYYRAILIDPRHAQAYCKRSVAFLAMNDLERALAGFDKAVELDASCAEAYRGRGRAYQELGAIDKAIRDFDKAIELDGEDAYSHYYRGQCFEKLKRVNDAILNYQAFIDLSPPTDTAYLKGAKSRLGALSERERDRESPIDTDNGRNATHNDHDRSHDVSTPQAHTVADSDEGARDETPIVVSRSGTPPETVAPHSQSENSIHSQGGGATPKPRCNVQKLQTAGAAKKWNTRKKTMLVCVVGVLGLCGLWILAGLKSQLPFPHTPTPAPRAILNPASQPTSASKVRQTYQPSSLPPEPANDRRLPNGTVIKKGRLKGKGHLTVENGLDRDAAAKLINTKRDTCVLYFYVSSKASHTVKGVPDGEYQLLFVTGRDWDKHSKCFSREKSFSEFNRSFSFTTLRQREGTRFTDLKVTLHSVPRGNIGTNTLSESEFTKH